MTEPSPIQNEIARQLHFTKPDPLAPGKDVGMATMNDPNSLRIVFPAQDRSVVVTYDEGADHYNVEVGKLDGTECEEFRGIYCDQMTGLVWGDGAKDFETELGPMVQVFFPEDGER